jgi:hypothetical protein
LLVRLHAENKQRLSFDEVVIVAQQCSMPTASDVISLEGEVRDALGTLHRLGQLLWWGDNESLKNTVVLDPQWLVTAFTTVIRDPSLHSVRWLDTELDRLVAKDAERRAKFASTEIKTGETVIDGRDDVTDEVSAGHISDSMLDLDMASAVLLLRNQCVLTESLFNTVWPVLAGDTALPPRVDDDTPRYTHAEQEVNAHILFALASETHHRSWCTRSASAARTRCHEHSHVHGNIHSSLQRNYDANTHLASLSRYS